MRVPRLLAVPIVAAFFGIASSTLAGTNDRPWGFSRPAATPCPDGTPSPTSYAAPDGTKVLSVDIATGGSKLHVSVGGARHSVHYAAWPCPELQWSTDSQAFFVNYSKGGAAGEYDVRIYYPSRDGIRVADPTTLVRKDFRASYPKCFSPEDPNVAAVGWLDGSRRLLVAAQVLPHSNCDSMGTFAAYEIDIPSGNILRKHGQLEAKTRFWELLGPELRMANDECIRQPKSCLIPALHGRQERPPN